MNNPIPPVSTAMAGENTAPDILPPIAVRSSSRMGNTALMTPLMASMASRATPTTE